MRFLHRWLVPRRWLDDALTDNELLSNELSTYDERIAEVRRERDTLQHRCHRLDATLAAIPSNVRSRLAHLEQTNATLLAKLDEATAELARRPTETTEVASHG